MRVIYVICTEKGVKVVEKDEYDKFDGRKKIVPSTYFTILGQSVIESELGIPRKKHLL